MKSPVCKKLGRQVIVPRSNVLPLGQYSDPAEHVTPDQAREKQNPFVLAQQSLCEPSRVNW